MTRSVRGDGLQGSTGGDGESANTARLVLRLYIAASAPNSVQAQANLRALLAECGALEYSLEVIDCLEDPLRALRDGVLVTPTLMKIAPQPPQTIIGTLGRREQLAAMLGLPEQPLNGTDA